MLFCIQTPHIYIISAAWTVVNHVKWNICSIQLHSKSIEREFFFNSFSLLVCETHRFRMPASSGQPTIWISFEFHCLQRERPFFESNCWCDSWKKNQFLCTIVVDSMVKYSKMRTTCLIAVTRNCICQPAELRGKRAGKRAHEMWIIRW